MIASAAQSLLQDQAVLAIVADPGMGKSRALDEIAYAAIANGGGYHRIDLKHCAGDDALHKLGTFARTSIKRLASGSSSALAIIDHMPPLDEAERDVFTRIISRFAKHGCRVVIALRPEAESNIEDLPSVATVHAEILLQDDEQPYESQDEKLWAHELCRNIPALIEALGTGPSVGAGETPGMGYIDCLCSLIEAALRPQLIEDELSLRYALLLLGHGDIDDLRQLDLDLDDQLLAGLARDAPLFGVDLKGEGFVCAGLASTDILAASMRVLSTRAASRQNLVYACTLLLCKRREFKRAALVASLAHDHEDMEDLVLRYALDLIDAGAADLVKEAIDKADRERRALVGFNLSAHVGFSALFEAKPSLGVVFSSGSAAGIGSAEERRAWAKARLLAYRRILLQGQAVPDDLPPEAASDPMASRLATHLRVLKMLLAGKATAALQLLIAAEVKEQTHATLSSAFLCADFELVSVLLADAPSRDARFDFDAAAEFLHASSRVRPLVYVDAVPKLRSFIYGDDIQFGAEPLVQQASRRNDDLARAALGIFSAVADLRAKSYVSAHVRASQIERQAKTAQSRELARAARIVDCLARAGIGEDIADEFEQLSFANDSFLASLASIMAAVLGNRRPRRLPRELPRDALWTLSLMSFGISDISELMATTLPEQWARQIDAARSSQAPKEARRTAMSPATPRRIHSSPYPVELKLLGFFELKVAGRTILQQSLEGRRALDLLVYMASAPGRSARRFEVVDCIWPEYDYTGGPNRVSQSIAQLRRRIQAIEPSVELFKINRSKLIIVDTAMLHSDLDDFDRLSADICRAEADDESVVEKALQMEALYRGDLVAIGTDGNGELEIRRQRLRTQYVDCMVAGAEAALRRGTVRVASRLAEKAALADTLREDAADALIRSFVAAGRPSEAQARYKSFAMHLVEVTGNPPSRELRTSMGEERARKAERRYEAARVANV